LLKKATAKQGLDLPLGAGLSARPMNTKYLIGFFVAIMISGMVAVIFFGIQPRAVAKVNLSQFSNANQVANTILMSMPQEIHESPIVFFGVNPQDPFLIESLQNFLILAQSQPLKFDAILADESFAQLQVPLGLSFEHFPLRQQKERLVSGLKGVLEKKLHLLVLLPSVEASHKLEGSLVSQIQPMLVNEQNFLSLVFANFPRRREDEAQMQIPCNTGSADQGQVGSVGCLILQTSRSLYRKHLTAGQWVGLINQVGITDYLFLLTQEPDGQKP
jgi:hypothetical protein